MEAYAVYVQTDTTEGRGGMNLDKVFTEVRFATSYVESIPDPWNHARTWKWEDGVGTYGHMKVRPFEIIDKDLAVEVTERKALIAAARAKLTPEELEALGI